MSAENYSKIFYTNQPASAVFESIQNFRDWWSEEIEGNTNVLNETFFYHYKDIHLCKIKLIEKFTTKNWFMKSLTISSVSQKTKQNGRTQN